MIFVILNIIILGIIYSLIAIGYNIIYKTSRIINFAQGELVVVSGVIWVHFTRSDHFSQITAALIGIGVSIFLAWFVYAFLLSFIKSNLIVNSILITLVYSILIQSFSGMVFSTDFLNADTPFSVHYYNIVNERVNGQLIFIFLMTVSIAFLLSLLYRRTLIGIRIRAISEAWDKAIINGIRPRRLTTAAFLISGALAGLTGVLITPISGIRYDQGLLYAIKGFAALIIGGVGNIWGSFLGGIILASFEQLSALLFPGLDTLIVYIVILVFLIFRPHGILGGPHE